MIEQGQQHRVPVEDISRADEDNDLGADVVATASRGLELNPATRGMPS